MGEHPRIVGGYRDRSSLLTTKHSKQTVCQSYYQCNRSEERECEENGESERRERGECVEKASGESVERMWSDQYVQHQNKLYVNLLMLQLTLHDYTLLKRYTSDFTTLATSFRAMNPGTRNR